MPRLCVAQMCYLILLPKEDGNLSETHESAGSAATIGKSSYESADLLLDVK